ncbi:MAG: CpaD family pilus assembly lipoprotein [Pseudomonadota bacterium]
MKQVLSKFVLLSSVILLGACTQTTPSMMNTSPITVAEEGIINQIPYKDITDETLSALATNYLKTANGALDLTMTYNPTSRSFTKYKAGQELKKIKNHLNQKGVESVIGQTMAVPNGDPTLIVTYNTLTAKAPDDCLPTPGLDQRETGRFIGEYKFGCGVDTMMARQITDPSDLYGKSGLPSRDARREATVIEPHLAGVPKDPIEGVEADSELGD